LPYVSDDRTSLIRIIQEVRPTKICNLAARRTEEFGEIAVMEFEAEIPGHGGRGPVLSEHAGDQCNLVGYGLFAIGAAEGRGRPPRAIF
jgi:hypothetical protein